MVLGVYCILCSCIPIPSGCLAAALGQLWACEGQREMWPQLGTGSVEGCLN